MRLPLLLLPLALAIPLGAQAFEGTIAMKVSAAEGDMTMQYAIKGDKMAMTLSAPASMGPLAGMEIKMLMDPVAKTVTMLMPLPAGMAGGGFLPADTKGIKTVTPIPEETGGAAEGSASLKKLGTSQTIAGMKCDDYEATSGSTTTMMCLATGMGKFSYPSLTGGMGGRGGRGGGRGGAGAAAPGWAEGMANAPGFPLKVWTADGKATLEVTSVQRGPVSNDTFTVPAGYVDLQAMMGGRGG